MKRKYIKILIISVSLLLIVVTAFFGIKVYQNNNTKFTVHDTLEDGNGKKAKVILLAGQSNASGCSKDEYLKKNVSSEKYAEYDNGYDNVYINYYVSGIDRSQGFVKCSTKQGEFGDCFGPELGLAEKLNELYPGETFFIIKYAWGGTDLFNLWLSPSSIGKTGDLYSAFVSYVNCSMKYLKSKNYDVQIEGMCWMQGESDSFTTEHAIRYEKHLTNLIKDIRYKFSRYAAQDGIAFIDAYIADNPVYWVYCDLVNESKRKVAEKVDMTTVIDTNALGLTCSNEPEGTPDMAHYDSLSEIKLGHSFAIEISKFF